MYPGMLEAAANVLKENYYILPSSVHEVILVPESKGTAPRRWQKSYGRSMQHRLRKKSS